MRYEEFISTKRVISNTLEALNVAITNEYLPSDTTRQDVTDIMLITYLDDSYFIEYSLLTSDYTLVLGNQEYTQSNLEILEKELYDSIFGDFKEVEETKATSSLADMKSVIMNLLDKTDNKTVRVTFFSLGQEVQCLNMEVRNQEEFDVLEKCVFFNFEYLSELHTNLVFSVMNFG